MCVDIVLSLVHILNKLRKTAVFVNFKLDIENIGWNLNWDINTKEIHKILPPIPKLYEYGIKLVSA